MIKVEDVPTTIENMKDFKIMQQFCKENGFDSNDLHLIVLFFEKLLEESKTKK